MPFAGVLIDEEFAVCFHLMHLVKNGVCNWDWMLDVGSQGGHKVNSLQEDDQPCPIRQLP